MTERRRARTWLASVAAGIALGAGCLQTVMRAPDDPVGGPREAARAWRIGGFHRAEHVVDPAERPLRGRIAPGEKRPLWLMPEGPHFGGPPRVRWESTRPDVAEVRRSGSSLGGELRGHAPGETRIHARVGRHGGVRVPLAYYCCGDSCDAVLPRCEWIPIASVVVSRR